VQQPQEPQLTGGRARRRASGRHLALPASSQRKNMDSDIKEVKRELLENNINRIIKLTAIMINSLDMIEDTELKLTYLRIHDNAMSAKRIINKA
jgi:hypothetical protein